MSLNFDCKILSSLIDGEYLCKFHHIIRDLKS